MPNHNQFLPHESGRGKTEDDAPLEPQIYHHGTTTLSWSPDRIYPHQQYASNDGSSAFQSAPDYSPQLQQQLPQSRAVGVQEYPSSNVAMLSSHGFYTPEFLSAYTYDIPEELIRVPTGQSVLDADHVVEDFGRTYHGYKAGKYLIPNDAAEQDRLDFQHAGFLILLCGMLYLAPLSHPKKVLDVATGTGIWAVEFAEKHPDTEVLGTDLSAIQPSNAPPNCSFIKDDSEAEWLFPDKFDYVHLRFVFTCFDNPREIMRNAFNSMSSGGWIEYQDAALGQSGSLDGNFDGTAFQRWQQGIVKGLQAALGRDIEVAPRYKEWLEEAGFVNVCERKVMWPVGPWSDDKRLNRAGAYMQKNYTSGALLAGWKSLRASGVPEDEARNLIEVAKQELADKNNRFYMVIYIVYGQKP